MASNHNMNSHKSTIAVHIGVARDQLAILKMLNKDKIKQIELYYLIHTNKT